jgi:signal transduction histidine kinase
LDQSVLYWQFWTSFWESWADAALNKGDPMKKQTTSPDAQPNKDIVRHLFENPEVKERAREEFLASMNHDLRTPLNAVIGFAQIIEKEVYGKVHPQYLEYAKHIQESGYDLLSKIEDMIDPPCEKTAMRKTAQPVQKKAKKLAMAD